MSMRRPALLSAALVAAGAPVAGQDTTRAFDHQRHERLFPTCVACHAGATDPEQPLWPAAEDCANCHDGVERARVAWQPPEEPRPSNLKFDHDLVSMMTRETAQGEDTLTCGDCHVPRGGPRMAVRRPPPEVCLECHAAGGEHLAQDTLCLTCHLPLPRARRLAAAAVGAFPAPPSHRAAGFVTRAGHGALARGPTDSIAPSCTVCHARDFCVTCHVDAPEQIAIRSLAPDPRALAITPGTVAAPPSHRDPQFLARHRFAVRDDPRSCSTCHARESCLACHAPSQHVADALPARGPGRAAGVQPRRRPPDSHGASFATAHASAATAAPASCAGCHVRPDCLACHRPASAAGPGFHPAGFLAAHAAAAYARETSCSDCHNVGGFCQRCHATAGLVSTRALGRTGYHDRATFFLLGHGQAARQSLETCVACHVERDCLTCHSALRGRHFSPHGPGFDAARLRRRNPEMCAACHGALIPGS
jgi:hypothetical protein